MLVVTADAGNAIVWALYRGDVGNTTVEVVLQDAHRRRRKLGVFPGYVTNLKHAAHSCCSNVVTHTCGTARVCRSRTTVWCYCNIQRRHLRYAFKIQYVWRHATVKCRCRRMTPCVHFPPVCSIIRVVIWISFEVWTTPCLWSEQTDEMISFELYIEVI